MYKLDYEGIRISQSGVYSDPSISTWLNKQPNIDYEEDKKSLNTSDKFTEYTEPSWVPDSQKNITMPTKNIETELSGLKAQLAAYKLKTTMLEEQLAALQRLDQISHDDLLQRMAKLERTPTKQSLLALEFPIKQILSKIPVVKNVYAKPIQNGFLLTIVYESETISDAVKQIQPGLSELEDAFPDTYFDPHLLHLNNVQEEHLQLSALIF